MVSDIRKLSEQQCLVLMPWLLTTHSQYNVTFLYHRADKFILLLPSFSWRLIREACIEVVWNVILGVLWCPDQMGARLQVKGCQDCSLGYLQRAEARANSECRRRLCI